VSSASDSVTAIFEDFFIVKGYLFSMFGGHAAIAYSIVLLFIPHD
jgi:hypothetical protein